MKSLYDYCQENPNKKYLLNEWNEEENNKLGYSIHTIGYSSNKKMCWKCVQGHQWFATVGSRVRGNGCSDCANSKQTSLPELALFFYISKYFPNVINSYKNKKIFGQSELDIFVNNIGIEYDGYAWHQDTSRDKKKDDICFKNNIHLIRVRERGCPKYDSTCIFIDIDYNSDGGLTEEFNSVVCSVLLELGIEQNNIDVDVIRDRADILNNYKTYQYNNSVTVTNPIAATMINLGNNGNLTSDNFTKGSEMLVEWRCPVFPDTHYGVDKVSTLCNLKGCPFCTNARPLLGFNTVWDIYPDVAKHFKNPELAKKHTPGSSKKVDMVCDKGHPYPQSINRACNGRGCPVCLNKKIEPGVNDFYTTNPEEAKQFDYSKGTITPDKFGPNAHLKVPFFCKECGESFWKSMGHLSRTLSKGYGLICPECMKKHTIKKQKTSPYEKSLQYLYPLIAATAIGVDTSKIYAYSGDVLNWRCPDCGEVFSMTVANRVTGHGCKKCGIIKNTAQRSKVVLKITADTIEEFPSMAEARRKGFKNVTLVVNNFDKLCRHCLWATKDFYETNKNKYDELRKMSSTFKVHHKNRCKKILVVETGEIIPSMEEALKRFSQIYECLKDETKTTKGFHFKLLNEL